MAGRKKKSGDAPEILNRKARQQFTISETLEVGIVLRGAEVKSVRAGKVSLGEGYVRLETEPPALYLHGVHVGEYDPAGPSNQHLPTRTRTLLAHKREILKLAPKVSAKGTTLVPLKLYFKDGRAKLLIGLGIGKRQSDKREDLKKREAQREIDRVMSKRM